MRIVVAVLSCLGFIGYGALLLHPHLAGPGSGDGAGYREANSAVNFLATVYPLAYFLICFFTTFARQRSVLLRAVGICIHSVFAAIVVTMAIKVGPEGAAIFGTVGAIFAVAWLIMYSLLPNDNANP
jgi:hypothetical protein